MTCRSFLPYWHARINPGPAAITEVSEYEGGEDLALVCTQLGNTHTASQQKKIVEAWCQFFAQPRPGLRRLWLHSKVPQALFDSLCQQSRLEGLYIKWSGITDLSAIVGLTALQHLHLCAAGVTDLSPLAHLQTLQSLALEGLYKVSDYRAVAALQRLSALSICGDGVASSRKAPLESLHPLTQLPALQALWLVWVKLKQGSYAELAALRSLRQLKLVGVPLSEAERSQLLALPLLAKDHVLDRLVLPGDVA
ncbi:hypothetical protein [Leeia sp.]|uniref:hypothetical protein n=1 Tax=Leeia sp. TaxID=2884678 RepID=UPI0035B224DF